MSEAKVKPLFGASLEEFPVSSASAEGMVRIPFGEQTLPELRGYVYNEEKDLYFWYIFQGKDLPLIFYVQGSAWKEQVLHEHLLNLYEFSKNGFNVVMPEYRPSSVAPFPAQVEDEKEALKFITENADELGFDKNRIFLWGDSSGAHTVSMMGVTMNRVFCENEIPEIKGVVDFFGPSHIATMNDVPSTMDHISPESPEGLLIGGVDVLENPELADRTVLMNYFDEDTEIPPFAIFHGTRDRLVPFEQSIEFYEKLKACGKDVVFYCLDGADHGGPTFWRDETMDLVLDFMRSKM